MATRYESGRPVSRTVVRDRISRGYYKTRHRAKKRAELKARGISSVYDGEDVTGTVDKRARGKAVSDILKKNAEEKQARIEDNAKAVEKRVEEKIKKAMDSVKNIQLSNQLSDIQKRVAFSYIVNPEQATRDRETLNAESEALKIQADKYEKENVAKWSSVEKDKELFEAKWGVVDGRVTRPPTNQAEVDMFYADQNKLTEKVGDYNAWTIRESADINKRSDVIQRGAEKYNLHITNPTVVAPMIETEKSWWGKINEAVAKKTTQPLSKWGREHGITGERLQKLSLYGNLGGASFYGAEKLSEKMGKKGLMKGSKQFHKEYSREALESARDRPVTELALYGAGFGTGKALGWGAKGVKTLTAMRRAKIASDVVRGLKAGEVAVEVASDMKPVAQWIKPLGSKAIMVGKYAPIVGGTALGGLDLASREGSLGHRLGQMTMDWGSFGAGMMSTGRLGSIGSRIKSKFTGAYERVAPNWARPGYRETQQLLKNMNVETGIPVGKVPYAWEQPKKVPSKFVVSRGSPYGTYEWRAPNVIYNRGTVIQTDLFGRPITQQEIRAIRQVQEMKNLPKYSEVKGQTKLYGDKIYAVDEITGKVMEIRPRTLPDGRVVVDTAEGTGLSAERFSGWKTINEGRYAKVKGFDKPIDLQEVLSNPEKMKLYSKSPEFSRTPYSWKAPEKFPSSFEVKYMRELPKYGYNTDLKYFGKGRGEFEEPVKGRGGWRELEKQKRTRGKNKPDGRDNFATSRITMEDYSNTRVKKQIEYGGKQEIQPELLTEMETKDPLGISGRRSIHADKPIIDVYGEAVGGRGERYDWGRLREGIADRYGSGGYKLSVRDRPHFTTEPTKPITGMGYIKGGRFSVAPITDLIGGLPKEDITMYPKFRGIQVPIQDVGYSLIPLEASVIKQVTDQDYYTGYPEQAPVYDYPPTSYKKYGDTPVTIAPDGTIIPLDFGLPALPTGQWRGGRGQKKQVGQGRLNLLQDPLFRILGKKKYTEQRNLDLRRLYGGFYV